MKKVGNLIGKLELLGAMAKMEQWLNLHNQLPNPNMGEIQSELKDG